jgi:hypothetical protein
MTPATAPPLDPLPVAQYLVRKARVMSRVEIRRLINQIDRAYICRLDDREVGLIIDKVAELLGGTKGGGH